MAYNETPTKGKIMNENTTNEETTQTEVGYPHIIVAGLAVIGTVVVAKKAIYVGRRIQRDVQRRVEYRKAEKSDSLWSNATDSL